MACYTVVTPINKNKDSNSNKDYKEQLERLKKGEQMMWDDTKNNSTKKSGGFFGFVHNSKYVDICVILNIKNPKKRINGDMKTFSVVEILSKNLFSNAVHHQS